MEEKGMLDERIPLQLLGSCQEAAGKLPGSSWEAEGEDGCDASLVLVKRKPFQGYISTYAK